jgi:predicted  nucleic acid-binding Zn-ribbon protein
MASTAELMREIHRLRRFARDLQEQIERAPARHQAEQAKTARKQDAVRENQEAIKKLKVTVHEKEVTLRTTHGQIGRYQQQLNEVGSKKEYDALQAEIAAAREKCAKLEEEAFAAMAETEERTANIPPLEQAAKQAAEEFANWAKDSDARMADLKRQLDETQAKLKEVEAAVPASARSQFERIVRHRGVDAFAPVQDGTCGACRTEITAQQYNDLLIGNFVACKSCGRILYLPQTASQQSGEGA